MQITEFSVPQAEAVCGLQRAWDSLEPSRTRVPRSFHAHWRPSCEEALRRHRCDAGHSLARGENAPATTSSHVWLRKGEVRTEFKIGHYRGKTEGR